jgi:hypothetical protein
MFRMPTLRRTTTMSEVKETHTPETMYKVSAALREADLSDDQIDHAIDTMQNYGILFREVDTPTLFD